MNDIVQILKIISTFGLPSKPLQNLDGFLQFSLQNLILCERLSLDQANILVESLLDSGASIFSKYQYYTHVTGTLLEFVILFGPQNLIIKSLNYLPNASNTETNKCDQYVRELISALNMSILAKKTEATNILIERLKTIITKRPIILPPGINPGYLCVRLLTYSKVCKNIHWLLLEKGRKRLQPFHNMIILFLQILLPNFANSEMSVTQCISITSFARRVKNSTNNKSKSWRII